MDKPLEFTQKALTILNGQAGCGRGYRTVQDGLNSGALHASAMAILQAGTLLKANAEIEADCWRFTLRGSTAPDPRPWSDLLAFAPPVTNRKGPST